MIIVSQNRRVLQVNYVTNRQVYDDAHLRRHNLSTFRALTSVFGKSINMFHTTVNLLATRQSVDALVALSQRILTSLAPIAGDWPASTIERCARLALSAQGG